MHSNTIPKFGIPINPKVHVSQETRRVQVPSAAAGGPPRAAAVGPQSSVPAAATSRREASQAFREHFAQVQNNIQQSVSQAEPEETPVEPPPIQRQGLPLDPAVLDRINSYGSISISRARSPSPIYRRTTKRKSSGNPTAPDNVVPPPPSAGENLNNILDKYKHL